MIKTKLSSFFAFGCLLHCLLILLGSMASAFAPFMLHSPVLEAAIITPTIIFALMGLDSFRTAKSWVILLGCALMVAGLLFFHWLTSVGALMVILTHWWKHHPRPDQQCCVHEHCESYSGSVES